MTTGFSTPENSLRATETFSTARTSTELEAEEWTAARSRTEQSEWGVGGLVAGAGRVLLVREGRWDEGILWAAPGGMLEAGETHAEGAVREIREETGIDVEIDGLAAIREQTYTHEDDPDRQFGFRFAMFDAIPRTTDLAADPGLDGEDIRAVEWFEALPENTYEREMLASLRNRDTE